MSEPREVVAQAIHAASMSRTVTTSVYYREADAILAAFAEQGWTICRPVDFQVNATTAGSRNLWRDDERFVPVEHSPVEGSEVDMPHSPPTNGETNG